MTEISTDIFDSLFQVIQDRKVKAGKNSYTATLFAKGDSKICEKIMEEAAEVVEAAAEADDNGQHLIHEASDLLFHLLVLLVHKGLTLESVRQELARRFGVSGLEEKANRNRNETPE